MSTPTKLMRPKMRLVQDGDRRRSERKPHVCEAWIGSPTGSNDDRVEIVSVNVSRHGVAFEIDRELVVGTFHAIEIGLGAQRMCGEIRVISCRQDGDGNYAVGAEFC